MTPAPYSRKESAKRSLERTKKLSRSIFIQGKLVVLKNTYYSAPPPPGKGRKEIKEYSSASRFRLLKQIATIDWEKLPRGLFVTLTYPDERADIDLRTATIQRHLWMRYVEKFVGHPVPMLWRKEYIDRKSGEYHGRMIQHFHVSVFTTKRLPMEKVNEWWQKAIAWDGYVRTEVKRMNNGEHAAFYLAKYLSKVDASPSLVNAAYLSNPGRAWGFHRPALIPRHPLESVIGLTDRQYDEIRRIVSAYKQGPLIDAASTITLLGDHAAEAAHEIFGILS